MIDLHHQTRAILFDLDGTLIDSTDLILQCFNHSWETVCGFNHSREALVQTFGTPLRAAMCRLLLSVGDDPSAGADSVMVDRLLAEYRSYNVDHHDLLARPFGGTEEVLDGASPAWLRDSCGHVEEPRAWASRS